MFSAKFPNESVPMRVFSDDHFDTLQEHIDAVWALGEEKCKAHLFTTSTGYELTCDEQCNDRWPKLFDAEGRHLIRLQKTMTCAVPTHEEFSVELDVEPIVERGEATEISWSVTDDADTANVTCTLSDLDEHGKWQTKWSGGAVLKKTFAYPTAGEVTLKVDCKSPERDFIASDYAHVRVGAPEPTVEVTVNGNLVEDGDIVEVVPEHGDIDGRQLSDILELFQEGEPQSPAGKKVTIKWTAENAVSCTLTDNLIGGTDDFISHFELVPGEPTDPEGERYGNPTGQYSYVSPTARDVFYNDTPSVIKSLRPRAEVAERELSENESIFGYGRPIRRALKLECLNEDDESAAVHFQLCTTAWWNKESKDVTLQCLNTL